jgi:hypothetical protein
MRAVWSPGRPLAVRSQSSFEGSIPGKAPASVLVGDTFNKRWKAHAGEQALPHVKSFGWSNLFPVSGGEAGMVRIGYAGRWARLAAIAMQAVLFAMALAMARRTRRGQAAGLRATGPGTTGLDRDGRESVSPQLIGPGTASRETQAGR